MSNHIGYFDGEIALGSSKLDVQNTIKANLTACGWQVITEDTTNLVLDVIPPATETIGDGRIQEVIRFRTEQLAIRVYGYMRAVADYVGQTFTIEEKTAGNVTGSVTIAGQTVTQSVSSAGNTATDNLRQLWLDLKASANATFLDWDFYYYPPYKGQVAGGDKGLIVAYRKTVSGSRQAISVNANVTLYDTTTAGITSGTAQKIGCSFNTDHTTSPNANLTRDLTIDLTSGFTYYMSVFARTIALSTKCNSGYTGPVVASYVDNTEARSVTPKGSPQLASPIELYILCLDGRYGFTNTTTDVRNYAMLTHAFGFNEENPGNQATLTSSGPEYWLGPQDMLDVFLLNEPSRNWFNVVTYYNYSGTATNRYWPIVGSIFGIQLSNSEAMDDFPIHVASSQGLFVTGGAYAPDYVVPPCNLPDVYAMLGNSPTESLHLAPDESTSTTTTANYDATTAYTTVQVTSTTGFPASGHFIINNEVWSFTGKTGTTLTGCTRAQGGTKAEPSTSGAEVRPGVWFVRFNRAAMRAGFAKPV